MLLNTFSPKMVEKGCVFVGKEVTLEEVKAAVTRPWPWMNNPTGHSQWLCSTAAISHKNTAEVLSTLLDAKVDFERKNITLGHGNTSWIIVPNFRATESREYSLEEVKAAGFSCYRIVVYNPAEPRYKVLGQADDVGGSLCQGGRYSTLAEAEAGASALKGEGLNPVWIEDSQK